MQKWEYMVKKLDGNLHQHQTALSELGLQGWELVSIINGSWSADIYLKRRIEGN